MFSCFAQLSIVQLQLLIFRNLIVKQQILVFKIGQEIWSYPSSISLHLLYCNIASEENQCTL